MRFTFSQFSSREDEGLSHQQTHQLAFEKLAHMHQAARQSLVPAFLGPLICIPLFAASAGYTRFYAWFLIANLCLILRAYLVLTVKPQEDVQRGIAKLNWAIGLPSATWGLGWLLLLPTPLLEQYLLYYSITLIFFFINMFGNAVNRSTLVPFIFPLQICLFAYYLAVPNAIAEWPIVIGATLFFFYSVKLGLIFADSWQKNIILRFRNEELLKALTIEKDISVAANIAKSDFIATASHDLRQPMQAINIFLALLDDRRISEAEKRTLIEKLKASADHLNKMFKTLLDISKLDAQSVQVKQSRFQIAGMVSDLRDIFQPVAAQKKLELIFLAEPMGVYGDRLLLQQILTNLIANAIQYTTTGGVTVSFLLPQGGLVVEVADTGCGIPAAELEFIFQEFYRVQSTRAVHDGLGLGLSIVNRLVKLVGGQLDVVSTPGHGTTFTLKTGYSTKPQGVEAIGSPGAQALAINGSPSQQGNLLAALHLAVIEDDEALREAYRQFFGSMGFTVHVIPLLEEEFHNSLLNTPQLDFIMSDYRLGHKNGVDYIQMIREEFNAEIPAVIITADTSPEHIKIFEELNIKTLHKPIEPEAILAHITKHFIQ
jgi:signal transduction histidine kinase/CheY-like chemotaxis protein